MHKHHLIINWELHGVSKKIHFWNFLRINPYVTYGSVWTTAGSKWSYFVLENLDRCVENKLIVGAKFNTIIMVFLLNFHRNRTQFLEKGDSVNRVVQSFSVCCFSPRNIYSTKCNPKRCIPREGLQLGRKILFLP